MELSQELKAKFINLINEFLLQRINCDINDYLFLMQDYYKCNNYANVGSWILNSKYNNGNDLALLELDFNLLRQGASILANDIISHIEDIGYYI